MKTILYSFLIILMMSPAWGQNTNPKKQTRKEKRELRKQERKRIAAENLAKTKEIIESKEFILQANTFITRYGNTIPVNSTTNFFATDGKNATIQLSFSDFIMGSNGIGGITVDGTVSKYEVKQQKHSTTIFINVHSSLGTYQVTIFANYGGISSLQLVSLRGDRFQFQGNFLSLEDNYAFKGTPAY